MTRYFKCIKDFWLHKESADKDHTPAFITGVTYPAVVTKDKNIIRFTQNNHGDDCHYMDTNGEMYQHPDDPNYEFTVHFEEVLNV